MAILIDLIFGVFVLTALAATFGFWLDKKFHTEPFISVILGIIAIIFGLSRLVIKSNQLSKIENKKNEK